MKADICLIEMRLLPTFALWQTSGVEIRKHPGENQSKNYQLVYRTRHDVERGDGRMWPGLPGYICMILWLLSLDQDYGHSQHTFIMLSVHTTPHHTHCYDDVMVSSNHQPQPQLQQHTLRSLKCFQSSSVTSENLIQCTYLGPS